MSTPIIYCQNCGCKVGQRFRRKTKKAYYTHECPKGEKGMHCSKVWVHFVDRLPEDKRRLLILGIAELRRRFVLYRQNQVRVEL